MQKLLTTGDVLDIIKPIGITQDMFRGWLERGGAKRGDPDFPAITPAVGGHGHGKHRQFTFMQVLGIVVAAKIYMGITGCHTSYIRMVVDAFTATSEGDLVKQFNFKQHGKPCPLTHFYFGVVDGRVRLSPPTWDGQVDVFETYRAVITSIMDIQDRLKTEVRTGRTGRVRGSAV